MPAIFVTVDGVCFATVDARSNPGRRGRRQTAAFAPPCGCHNWQRAHQPTLSLALRPHRSFQRRRCPRCGAHFTFEVRPESGFTQTHRITVIDQRKEP